MKFIDLFAGIGGFHSGMEKAGHECVGWVEWDKFARKSYKSIYNTGGVYNAKDIRNVAGRKLPKADVWCFGSPCFVKGTLVTTDKGLINIENIKIADKVLTKDGTFQKVTDTMEHISSDIYSLKAQGMLETKVTGNHPYLVRKRYEKHHHLGKEVYYSSPDWIKVSEIKKGDLISSGIPKNIKNTLTVTNEEAWLLGRYIADGHIVKGKRPHRINSYNHKVVFSIGTNKVKEFKSHLSKYHASSCLMDGGSCTRFTICSEHLMKLAECFGRGAINKEIPIWVCGLSKDKRMLLIEGMMSGDGSRNKRGFYRYDTISKKLAISLQKLIETTLNVGVSLFYFKRSNKHIIEGREVNQHDSYTLQYKLESKITHYKKYEGTIWYPVKGIKKLNGLEESVYNLEVAKNHTYTANGIIVHNCQNLSIAGKQEGLKKGEQSSMFFEVIRLLEETDWEKKPSYLFMENVKALLSSQKGWDFTEVLYQMDKMGYDVEWSVINSSDVVPQNRERIYIVGHLRGRGTRKVFPIRQKSAEVNKAKLNVKKVGNINPSGRGINGDVIDSIRISKTLSTNKGEGPKALVKRESRIKRVFDGREAGTYGSQDVVDPSGIAGTLNTMSGGNREPKIAIPVLTPDRINKRQNGRRFKNDGEPEFTLTSQDRHGVMVKEATKKGYDVATVGDSINIAQPNSKTRRGRVGHDIANTLVTGSEQATLTQNYRIRKLTPLECWRLQGFTDEQFHKAEQVNSNSQLYKQAGNSVTVSVIYEIAKRL